MKGYADLADMDEDDRIELIGHRVSDHHEQCAFIVEDDAKADRYIAKVTARFPGVTVKSRGRGPTPGTIAVILIPAERVN